jgi:hypothetical protein
VGLGACVIKSGLGFGSCSKIGFGVRPAGLAQNPGPRGLRLLVYVVKARALSSGLGTALIIKYVFIISDPPNLSFRRLFPSVFPYLISSVLSCLFNVLENYLNFYWDKS